MMTDLRDLLHEAAPVPSRPLDMSAVRARSKQVDRLRLVAWLAGFGAFVGIAVPSGTLLVTSSNDGRTTHVAIDEVATTAPALVAGGSLSRSSTDLPDATPGSRARPAAAPHPPASSTAANASPSGSAPTSTTTPLVLDDSETETHRYVAHEAHFVGTAAASEASGTMFQGDLTFVPRSDHVTITVDDDVVESQTISVSVTHHGVSQHLCVLEGAPTRIVGLEPGVATSLVIWDAAYTDDCTSGGTTGVLTIVLPE
jgi:hypothetical protein